ncbi:unnamed protein product [marine sediment metagenome]|uniref:Uncharacterized protein n=1 Tax=marine sediment metagenome TaxID=412755 RepID=X1VES4_9ZZZZ
MTTGEKGKTQEKKEPEMVALKEVAKKAGVEPREARSILRKLAARGEGEKRQRWQFFPKEVDSVVSKIKGAVAEKAKAKEAKAAAAEEEEE